MDDSASFDDPEIEQTLSATSYTPSKPLSDGEYYWRVRSVNDLGSAGEWSDARTVVVSIPPLAPLPLTPTDDETLDAATSPTFSWEAVSNGDTYQIQVDDTEDFSTPAFDDTAETTTRELPEPLTDGTYFWRVRAMNVYGVEGAWSEVQTFTVTSTPAAPTLLTPETDSENAQVTATTTFSWEAVVNGVTYQLQVDNNEDFSSPEVEDVAASTTREMTALGNGLYYWRVRAINMNGIPGEWSLVWNFTVNVEGMECKSN
ncbi:SusE domain-containing protein [Candidatus Villigracilis affinis]|uniref:SusE domain-containing protein n=1 Tax=Candidatus Villigracilis affinis TaxID=3140682 RepID=UPI002A23035D|nr:hypothetical protein [Anaerolineales bacterium]